MSNHYLLIKHLSKSIPQQQIKVRVIRLCRELMDQNLNENANYTAVFMDEQGDRILGCVDKMFIEQDRPRVREGDVLIMTNFSVIENIDTYKVINSPFKIVLHEETRVEYVESFIGSMNGFRFVHFDDILDKNITDNQCVDVIGEVVGILKPKYPEANIVQHELVTILLKDLEGSRIQCTLSNDYMQWLMTLIGNDTHCHKILIIQFGIICTFDGIVKVRNSKYATRLFLNGDVPEYHAYIKSITSSTTSTSLLAKQAVYLSPERFFANSRCTRQLDQITDICQVKSCILLATVTDISNQGWVYIACVNCNKNVSPIIRESTYHDRGYPVFECLQCSAKFKCVVPRYRVQVTAIDEQTKISTSLILFDSQVTKMIGKSALSLYDLFADNRDTIPLELYEMVGKQWLFRLPKNNLHACTHDANIVSFISDDHVLINVFNEILATQSGKELEQEIK